MGDCSGGQDTERSPVTTLSTDQDQLLVAVVALGHRLDDSRVVHAEARTLAPHYRVHVFAKPTAKVTPWLEGVELHSIGNGGPVGVCDLIRTVARVLQMRAVLVHCHDVRSWVVGCLVKMLKRRTKVVCDVHELYWSFDAWKSRDTLLLRLLHWLVHRVVARFLVDGYALVVPQQRTFYGRHGQPNVVLFNYPRCVGDELMNGRVAAPHALPLTMVYAGGLRLSAGLVRYLEITKELLIRGVDPRLLLVGWWEDACTEQRFRDSAASLGLADRICVKPTVSRGELGRLLRGTSVGLCLMASSPNNDYGLSRKMLEYMACGVPTLGSRNLANFRELVEARGCGLAVDYDDTGAAADAVMALVADHELFVARCLSVSPEYCWESQEWKLLQLYAQLLRNEPCPAHGHRGSDCHLSD